MNSIYSLLLWSLTITSPLAFADAPMTYSFDIPTIIKHFDKKKNPTDNDRFVILFAKFGRDVLSMTNFDLYTDQIELLKTSELVTELRMQIQSQPWTAHLAKDARAFLIDHRARLKNFFTESSYEGAWILNQIGETKAAAEKLQPLYEREFAYVMNLVEVDGLNSFRLAQVLYQALLEVAPAKDHRAIKEKMRKMKAHVSSLPDSQAFT